MTASPLLQLLPGQGPRCLLRGPVQPPHRSPSSASPLCPPHGHPGTCKFRYSQVAPLLTALQWFLLLILEAVIPLLCQPLLEPPDPQLCADSNIPGPLLPMGLSAASSAWSSLTFLPYEFDVLPQFLKSLLTCHLLDEVHLDCPLSFDDLTSAHWPCSPS